MGTLQLDEFKQRQRATWASGDYPRVAEYIQPVADGLVREAGAQQGHTVLDVATGSGNVAIPAAKAGASVTGLDLVPDFFEVGRRRAADAGVEVEWVEGDAEALPFADGSFDQVLSVFGVMFAPRHELAAAELLRVCRPGGTIGMCSWTPTGAIGQFFRAVGGFMPAPPDYAAPPPLWGTEEHIEKLLGDRCQLDMERQTVRFEEASPEQYWDWFSEAFGPLVSARNLLSEERFAELRSTLLGLWETLNTAPEGLAFEAEYLRVLAYPG